MIGGPAKTFVEPVATEVHPVNASPTLPTPLPPHLRPRYQGTSLVLVPMVLRSLPTPPPRRGQRRCPGAA